MTTMKIKITPEMRIQLMHAETIEIDVPDAQAEFVGSLRQQLLTQDNRCTADPFFVVFSKRLIVVDEDYDHDLIVWCREDDSEVEATESQHRRLEALHRGYRKPEGWRRLAIKEIDQFETACFTEQGCKDYLAVNGHNLRKPFTYAHSLFRNREMLELRKMLMAEPKEKATTEAWRMMCGDWRDDLVSLHGQDGLIASGLTVDQATRIIAANGGARLEETKGGAA